MNNSATVYHSEVEKCEWVVDDTPWWRILWWVIVGRDRPEPKLNVKMLFFINENTIFFRRGTLILTEKSPIPFFITDAVSIGNGKIRLHVKAVQGLTVDLFHDHIRDYKGLVIAYADAFKENSK